MSDEGPVEGTFTGTGVSVARRFAKGSLTIGVASGDTLTGTYQVQKRIGGHWLVVAEYTEPVLGKNIDHGSPVMTRIAATAHSGDDVIYSFG